MTLGRLLELYKAEQDGKQIMLTVVHTGYFETHTHIKKVKIAECELKDLINITDDGDIYYFFIENEEDEFGYKLN